MATTTTLKRRITSIKNTRQITKAMELVSASKMRRAQEQAKRSRDYGVAARNLMARLGSLQEVDNHPLFKQRKVKARLYVVITSNSGLAGAYNSNVLRQLAQLIKVDRDSGVKSFVITVGSKGAQFVRRLEHANLLAVYPAFGDQPTPNDIRPILNTVIDQYRQEEVDEVSVLYTDFISNLVQQAKQIVLLPARPTVDDKQEEDYKYPFSNFEPSVEVVLDNVTARLIEVEIWQSMLESLASEHSMRMLAMKNASDNANDLIGDYTLEYNTARQGKITQELAEITGGAEALKD